MKLNCRWSGGIEIFFASPSGTHLYRPWTGWLRYPLQSGDGPGATDVSDGAHRGYSDALEPPRLAPL